MTKFKKHTKKKKCYRTVAKEGETDESTMDRILHTKKRRTLINQLEQNRGISSNALLSTSTITTQSQSQSQSESESQSESQSRTKRKDAKRDTNLDFNVSGETKENEDMHGHGVMRLKHLKAMEEYVQKKQSQTKDVEDTQKKKVTIVDNSMTIAAKEGDVGAGGAMLGGTGIAEVILPIDHRLQNIQKTEAAARAKEENKPNIPKIISQVGSSYSHNYALHNQDWIQQKIHEKEKSNPVPNEPKFDESNANLQRPGFDAIRKFKGDNVYNDHQDITQKNQSYQRSSDDRVWGTFVKNQKSRGRL